MASYPLFSLSKDEMEDTADNIKLVILQAMVDEGYMDFETADKWCKEHTIIQKKKNIFKTLSDLWNKAETVKDAYYWVIVKLTRKENEDDG